jgi:hypothetical protein
MEELLLACLVLVRRDGAQSLLAPAYDVLYCVLKWSNRFFLLQIVERTDKISTLRLKLAGRRRTQSLHSPRAGDTLLRRRHLSTRYRRLSGV